VRNASWPHWRRWLGVESRCVVPATEFAEPDPASKKEGERTPNARFAVNEDRPLFFFAGIWTRWTSVRKLKEGEVETDLYAFFTTQPNRVVEPIHKKGNAGDFDHARGNRHVTVSAMGRGKDIAAASAGRSTPDRRNSLTVYCHLSPLSPFSLSPSLRLPHSETLRIPKSRLMVRCS